MRNIQYNTIIFILRRIHKIVNVSSFEPFTDKVIRKLLVEMCVKAGLYRIWCGVNRLGDSGVHTLGDTSACVNPVGQLLLTWRGKIGMDGVSIVFEFYIAPL